MKIGNFLLITMYSLIISMVTIFVYDKYKIQPQIQKLYMIDSQLIVEQKKKELKDIIFNKGQQPSEEAIVKYLKTIDQIVEYISKRDNATVVIKGAIASKNIKDITQEVLQIYKKEVQNKSLN